MLALVVASADRDLRRSGYAGQGVRSAVMSMHKLTAGDGYLYLVRQVAAADSTKRGRSALADYYSAKGESPGRWTGRGLAALADTGAREVSDQVRQQVWAVDQGSVVTEEQMKALFGLGWHPNADKIYNHLSPRLRVQPATAATQLGRQYPAQEEPSSAFTRRVGTAFHAHNIAAGLPGTATIDDDVRAGIRTRVATEMFTEQYDRAPADARELSGFIARVTRARTTAVAGYDLTFSPVKSISALWAIAPPEISEQIEAAHEAAVADVLEWLQDHAAFTRTGTNGVAQVDTEGLIAAVFTHRDSRAGDPDLHTHVAISNKVSYLDHHGVRRWLALDGQPLHRAVVAASEMYNTRLEAHTIDRLGVDFAETSRGRGKRPVREIVGMSPELMTRWSSRGIAIKARTAELAKQFQHDHGREPTTLESLALAQQATLETREAKHEPRSLAEQRDTWRHHAVEVLGHDGIDRMLAGVLTPERARIAPPEVTDEWVAAKAGALIATVSESRATWQRHHVRAEALRVVRNEGVAHVSQLVERLTATALSEAFSVPHARIDDAELGEPVALRRRDGSSVYRRHGTATYTSRDILTAEQRILAAAHQLDGRVAAPADVRLALADAAARGKSLNEGQAALVAQMALSGRRVGLALAPAGAGKTTAMAALAHAWRSSGGQVLGLAPTAAAAIVLGEDLGATTDTLDKYVHCTEENNAAIYGTPDWFTQVGPDTLIVVDEAGMASTAGLDAMITHALDRGASVRLVGDDAQLASISAGGVLRDIATDTGALTLSEVVRFHSRAEAAASLALRGGDPAGIGFYLDAGRIHIGTEQTAADAAFTAWQADQDAGRDSLLLAPTNAIVNELNSRARTARLAAALEADPHATPGRESTLSDGLSASVGDVIRTRRNNRQLPLTRTDYVRNGYTFTIVAIAADGALQARHRGTGREITLPADYVTDHVTLGYATTIDAAQGSTAHACHVVGAEHLTRQHLYVALTRGRAANHLYLSTAETDPHRILSPKATHPDTAVDVLSRIVARDGTQVSATTAARQTADPARRLAAAADMFTDALATAAEHQLSAEASARLDALAESLHPDLTTCTAWPVLRRRLAIRALSGADPDHLLTAAHARGGLDNAADPAAILDYRIDLTDSDGRDCGPLRWLPAIPTALADNPHWGDYLSRREHLVTDLADQIRDHARAWTTETAPPWARPLLTAHANPTLTAEIAVFRAATNVEQADTRLTGSPQYPVATRAVQDLLQHHGITALEHHRPDTTQWHDLLDAMDPRIRRADDYWPTLAAQLAEAAPTNDIHQLLTDAARQGPLPDEMPAAALWWRITEILAARDPQTVERTPAEDARTHTSDRALVEVLAAAHRNGDPLPLSAPQPKPVATALNTPYVVTTLAVDHDTPELDEAIAAAAAHAGRPYLRVPATPQPDRYSLAELAEKVTDHQPSRRKPPVIVIEDPAAADPAHLATVATALADAHGRLLLIDNGQPGPARRLLDGMALPWSENTNPTPDIEDSRLATAAANHRAAAQKRWRTLTTPLGRDRGRDKDRDQSYGVDID